MSATSLCFLDGSGACNPANTTATTCTPIPSSVAAGYQCQFRITFTLTPGTGGTLSWSMSGTDMSCSLPPWTVAPRSGQVKVSTPAPAQITYDSRSDGRPVLLPARNNPNEPGTRNPSTAMVTAGAASSTSRFYGTAGC